MRGDLERRIRGFALCLVWHFPGEVGERKRVKKFLAMVNSHSVRLGRPPSLKKWNLTTNAVGQVSFLAIVATYLSRTMLLFVGLVEYA